MTVVLVSGALAFVVGLLVLRPLSVSGSRSSAGVPAHDDGRHRELLRQLRDLDDDLAAGKLTQEDHLRLRGPVEREAAAALRSAGTTQVPAAGPDAAGPEANGPEANGPDTAGPEANGPEASRDAGRPPRWRRRALTLLALAGAAGAITFLLVSTISARSSGQAITGNSVPGAPAAAPGRSPAPPSAPSGAKGSAPASQSGQKSPTPRQLAAVAAAEVRVERNPKNVNAHLALAEAYVAAGASQLATVEYVAVTRLDPANPEANTNLALLAFQVGHAAQAKAMVDRVLAANPTYAEALYVRGVIDLIGLKRPAAATHDLNAYLDLAPFGSHRNAAVTLLALAKVQSQK
ncbi:MAG TPA: hypothetical protein VFQ44_00735 [Streptosporangiaceae bacterium]|nr:hypothetical protein [Streptosporangiaceae bacterium]